MIKSLLRWFVPPGFQDLLRDWKGEWQASRVPRHFLAGNEPFRNLHKDGKRCFILCTGPSIKTQDLSVLRNETCIAVSNFCVHPQYDLIRPAYYCIPKLYFPPATMESAVQWFTDINARMGDAKLFLTYGDQDWVREHRLFQGKTVNYLAFGRRWDSLKKDGIDLTKPLPKMQSVPVMALQIAIFLGFKEIYLLGCDHDHLLHYGITRHFYEVKDHAISRTFTPSNTEWSPFEEEVRQFGLLSGQYRALRSWAEPQGIRIYNATPGGLLMTFERVRFESLFEGAKG